MSLTQGANKDVRQLWVRTAKFFRPKFFFWSRDQISGASTLGLRGTYWTSFCFA